MSITRLMRGCLAGLSVIVLAACGGGGGGGTAAPIAVAPPPAPPAPPPVMSSAPTFTPGVFDPEADFEQRCETPRTGINPANNAPFTDVQGSTLIENFWNRSWSNRTYLFFDEIVDVDPNDFANDRLGYFQTQRTTRTTASGAPVDQFHFNIPTEENQARVSSGVQGGYGAQFAILQSSPPRDVRVAFVDPDSPASDAGLTRGARILEADGVSVVNGADVDTLNAALFPDVGTTHDFLIEELNTGQRTISLTAANVVSPPVLLSRTFDSPTGTVGYVVFNSFGTAIAEEQLFDAFTDFSDQGVSDVIIDLRYNGGGFLAISSQLAFMVAGEAQTSGAIYERLRFNSRQPQSVNPITGGSNDPTPFFNQGLGFSIADGTPLPSLDLPRVFILSASGTCSASESLINGLRGIDVEVILIGDTTCGKPYGFFGTDNCGETYFTIQFAGSNNVGFEDYADGFTPENGSDAFAVALPGCQIIDDFGAEFGDPNEVLLSAALAFQETGQCPAPAASGSVAKSSPVISGKAREANSYDPSLSLYAEERGARARFFSQNRIMDQDGQNR